MKSEEKRHQFITAYEGQRIVVTGGTGYIATNLLAVLKDVKCHIIRLSRPGTIFPSLAGKATVTNVATNITDSSLWEQLLKGVDIVFHLAAQTSAYTANNDPTADMAINVAPLLALLETCRRQQWQPVVVMAGTVTITGIPGHLPVDETQRDNPMTIYCLHKLMAENYLKYYAQEGVARGVTLRLANVYGPGPQSSSSDRGVINLMIRRAIRGETLTIYGEGDQVRDYVYIDDVVNAFLMAGACIEQLNGHHFIIGSGQGYTIREAIQLVAERAKRHTERPAQVIHVPPPPNLSPVEARNFIADMTRFSQATTWQPTVKLKEGVDRTINHLLGKGK